MAKINTLKLLVSTMKPRLRYEGYAVEKARTEQELLNAAQKAGVAITPELRNQIAQTSEQWALATVEANKLAEAQDDLRQKAEEWRDTEKDSLKGLVSDFAAGKGGWKRWCRSFGRRTSGRIVKLQRDP